MSQLGKPCEEGAIKSLPGRREEGVPKSIYSQTQSEGRRRHMAQTSAIRAHMEVIGADGVHIGTVDKLEGNRIKLTKKDSGQGSHQGHHHYIPAALVAEIEGDKVRLSANADVAVTFADEADGGT
jgi:hypothetical protein